MKTTLMKLHWGWALLALLPLWCVGMFDRGLWTPDEPREADIAWRMAHQPQKVVPYLADQPFLEKPPLSYWMAAGAEQVIGAIPAALRTPNLLYAVITTMAVGLLASGMAGARAGFFAAMVFGTMFEVYRVAIWLAPDAALMVGCAVSLLGAYRGFESNDPHSKLRWYLLMHVGALLGFMAKSAPGWLVPGLALLGLMAVERNWRDMRNWRLWLGLLLQVLVIGGWLLAVGLRPGGMEEIKVLLWNNLAGRFTDLHATGAYDYASGHKNWPGKYLLEAPYYLFPWGLLALAGVWTAIRRWSSPTARVWRFAVMAAVPFLLLLSVATTARDVYFAPVCIGLALLSALWLEELAAAESPGVLQRLALGGTRLMLALFNVLVIAGLCLVARYWPDLRWRSVAGIVALLVLQSALWALRRRFSGQSLLTLRHGLIGYVAAWLIAGVCLNPVIDQVQNLQGLAASIRADQGNAAMALVSPDETTIAMMDFGVGQPLPRLEGDNDAILMQATYWFDGDQERRLLLLMPGTGSGPLVSLIKPSSRERRTSLAAELVCHGLARVVGQYELPHGRRYAVLAPALRSGDTNNAEETASLRSLAGTSGAGDCADPAVAGTK